MANFREKMKPLKKTAQTDAQKKYKYRIGKAERRTFLIRSVNSDKLERMAYAKGTSMNEILNKILDLYFENKDFEPTPQAKDIEGF